MHFLDINQHKENKIIILKSDKMNELLDFKLDLK